MKEAENFTSVKEFILLGLTSQRKIQFLLFGVILIIYLLTLLGNLMIIILVQVDLKLHTPMYYFLSHLAGLDMCFVTSTMPLMLTQLLSGDGAISFTFCMTQMHFSTWLGAAELVLLGVMAYDRYLAICRPFIYPVLMSKHYQLQLASACWITGFLISTICVACLICLNYCGPNKINHFMCELPVMLKLACGDIRIAKVIVLSIGGYFVLVPLSIVLTSYGFILHTVLQMKSGGRRKTFSTCGSHLIVVSLFYGPLFCMYLLPKNDSSSDHDKQMAVFYIVITPLLNCIIYTLRNKDIHQAVAKIL